MCHMAYGGKKTKTKQKNRKKKFYFGQINLSGTNNRTGVVNLTFSGVYMKTWKGLVGCKYCIRQLYLQT